MIPSPHAPAVMTPRPSLAPSPARSAAIAAILAAAIAAPRAALADTPEARRKVVVLEYRAGSAALAGIDDRIAELLRSQTSLAVIDGDGARQAYGGSLDADVVRCAGEAPCIARIGGKIGAAEVLLVGISEFGDVILTLQRIDVADRDVSMRIAEALAEDATPDEAALGAYVRRVMPESDFLRFGTIRISANLAGAAVFLDRARRGTTPIDALKVRAPATYEIRLTKAGYVPFSAKVAVPPDGEVDVAARLTREGGGPWYGEWWVLALAGVVVAGGVGVGFYLAQDTPTSAPVTGVVEW